MTKGTSTRNSYSAVPLDRLRLHPLRRHWTTDQLRCRCISMPPKPNRGRTGTAVTHLHVAAGDATPGLVKGDPISEIAIVGGDLDSHFLGRLAIRARAGKESDRVVVVGVEQPKGYPVVFERGLCGLCAAGGICASRPCGQMRGSRQRLIDEGRTRYSSLTMSMKVKKHEQHHRKFDPR